jgi:hypothetical protein
MISEKQKQEINTWITDNYERLCTVRIRIGQSNKAETVALLTIDEELTETQGQHSPKLIDKEEFSYEIFQIIDQNGYGTTETFLRLYGMNAKNKQFTTIQKTCHVSRSRGEEFTEQSIVESFSRVVQPLAQAILKSNQQLINSHEILTHANSHYQDTSLRMMEAMIETKEEGIDYINLAMQMKVLLENNQQPDQNYSDEMGDKLLNAFGSFMNIQQKQPKQPNEDEEVNVREKPTKEEMKAWAQDPAFVMNVADVFNDLQNQNNTDKEE